MKTTITLTTDTLEKLNILKYKYHLKSIEEVIIKLMNLLTKFKLHEEFKDLK